MTLHNPLKEALINLFKQYNNQKSINHKLNSNSNSNNQ